MLQNKRKKREKWKRGRLEVETFAIIKIKCLRRRDETVATCCYYEASFFNCDFTFSTLPAAFCDPSPTRSSPAGSNLCINLIEFAAPFARFQHTQIERERKIEEKERSTLVENGESNEIQ